MPVKVITDSTSDLPSELAEQLDITVVPVNVMFGQEQFKDGVELAADQFYDRLVNGPVHPTTSAPSIGQFVETFETLGKDADGIVSIHVSSKLSATYNVAVQALEQADLDCPVEILDSFQASLGLGMNVIAAAKSAKGGADFETVAAVARTAKDRSQCIALLDTLEYLQRGGRIGKARAFLGSILRIKPMIIVNDGEVQPLGRARTYAKGVAHLKKVTRDFGPAEELGVMYTTSKDVALEIGEAMRDLLPEGIKPFVSRLGPGVGSHVGPEAVGISILRAK